MSENKNLEQKENSKKEENKLVFNKIPPLSTNWS